MSQHPIGGRQSRLPWGEAQLTGLGLCQPVRNHVSDRQEKGRNSAYPPFESLAPKFHARWKQVGLFLSPNISLCWRKLPVLFLLPYYVTVLFTLYPQVWKSIRTLPCNFSPTASGVSFCPSLFWGTQALTHCFRGPFLLPSDLSRSS